MPNPDDKIIGTTRQVLVIPPNEEHLLVVVRTVNQDQVMSFQHPPDQILDMPVVEFLSTMVQQAGMTARCILECTDGGELDPHTRSLRSATYPTVALVDTTDGVYVFTFAANIPKEVKPLPGRFKFRGELPPSAPRPLQLLFIRAKFILRRASSMKENRLQHIHLARAALHLIVSASETSGAELGDDEFAQILGLETVLDEVEAGMCKKDSAATFALMCQDFEGAVEIRRSYMVYQQFCQMDADELVREGHTISSSLGNLRLPRGKSFITDPGPTAADPIATMLSQVSLEDPSASIGDEPRGGKSSNHEPDKPEIKLSRSYERDGGGGSNNRERLHNVLKNAGFIENATYTWRYEVVIRGGHHLHRATFTFGAMVFQNSEMKLNKASAKEATATLALPAVQSYIRSLPTTAH
ncbi:hypothetical protein FRC17_009771 [Serendipita sp. 399]|nr:hypothetical protein FRC17_009771 [Serendipita sp. 399]